MVRRNMTNNEIYSIGLALIESIANENLNLPIKVNFYLQKNITTMIGLAEELEKSRTEILNKYGTQNENGGYEFADDKLEEANQALEELFSLEQEVPIYELDIDDFGDIQFDAKQTKAISFMIKTEEE